MSQQSIPDVLATLERQLAVHQKREAFHAEQEALHREQRSYHAAEIEKIARHLEAFRAASSAALDLAAKAAAVSAEEKEDIGPAYRPKLGLMVEKVIAAKGASERFGPNGLTHELNQRFGKNLRNPVTVGQISVVLRRMQRYGKIHRVRRGRPHWEALYVREGGQQSAWGEAPG